MAIAPIVIPDVPVFPSPGRCIYCGVPASEARLTDEHIVPMSLGGEAYIDDASCLSCNDKTHRFEGYIGRKQLFNARLAFGHRGRRNRRDKKRNDPWPTELPITVRTASGWVIKSISVADHPTPFTMLEMPPPGILLGRNPAKDPDSYKWIGLHRIVSPELAASMEAERARMDTPIDARRFAQLLARIGHTAAVAFFGLDAFEPLLPEMILRPPAHLNYLVGNIPSANGHKASTGPTLHFLSPIVVKTRGREYATIVIRLYSTAGNPGPPIYVVVAGPLRDPQQPLQDFIFRHDNFDSVAKDFLSWII